MVLYILKWNVFPDKVEAYKEWSKTGHLRCLAVPGVVEFRGYRPATGASQVVTTYEFADLAAWAAWYVHEDVQKVMGELRTLTTNVITELWNPSPAVPQPIRPEK